MENASGRESFLALLSSVESQNGWISSQDSFPDFAFGTGSPKLSSTNEIIDQCEENINGDMHPAFFSDKESIPDSEEDDNSSDDEAIWTKEVPCGDGYYADTSDSEIFAGKAKSTENTPISSYLDYDSGSGSRYCYRKQRPEVFSMSVSEKEVLNPVEIAMRSFCSNRSVPMFKPELGMTFSSAAEGYQFYNLYSWVLGFSIRNGDAYQKKDGQRTMQEFNCQRQELLKASSYVVTKYIPSQMFEVTHVDAEKREAWSRVVYKIYINEAKKTFLCECGLFEHFGILCCHALKALIHMGVSKIPDAHIMKRWTKNARSSAWGKSSKGFADEDLSFNRSLRHKRLYMAALEMVRLGEEDDAMSEIAFKNIEKANKEMSALKKMKTSTCQVGYGSCRSDNDDIFHTFGADSSDTDGVELHIQDPKKKIMIPVSTIKSPIIPISAGRTKVKRHKSRLHGNVIKDKVLVPAAAKFLEPGGRTGVHQTRFCSRCRSPYHDIRTCTATEQFQCPQASSDDDFASL